MNTNDLFLFFTALAKASGKLILQHYSQASIQVDTKADQTPVTIADRSAEELLRELIKKRYPSHGIIGEEHGSENPDAEFVWVLDPIDGTKSFIHHVPLFTTLIGLMQNGTPIAGAIHQPVTGTLALADRTGTFLDGRQVKVRGTSSLSDATILLSGTEMNRELWTSREYPTLLSKAKLTRTWGDGYGYMLVGAGYADVIVDPALQIWDLCAVMPIIRGAGGTITAVDGGDPLESLSAVATNTVLHDEVLRILKPQ